MSLEELRSWRREKAKRTKNGLWRLRRVFPARYFEDIFKSYEAEPYIPLYDNNIIDNRE